MPIYAADIVTREASTPGQEPESGGPVSEVVSVHYEIGDFPRLTEIKDAAGSVDFLHQFMAIQTSGTERADDSYTFLDEIPADSSVSVLLYRPAGRGTIDAHQTTRQQSRDYIESYQTAGALAPYSLYGDHDAGRPTLDLQSLPAIQPPAVGATLYLDDERGEELSEYAQIIALSSRIETITMLGGLCGVFDVAVHTCTLRRPLQYQHTGEGALCASPLDPDVQVRECVPLADRRFYSLSSLATAAEDGDTVLHVDTVYHQAAPSARKDVPLSGIPALRAGQYEMASGGYSHTISLPVHTQYEEIAAGTERLFYSAVLVPAPADGSEVRAHVRIGGGTRTIREGETSGYGQLTRTGGNASLSLNQIPDPDSVRVWEWATAAHDRDRAGESTALMLPRVAGQVTLPEGRSVLMSSVLVSFTRASDSTARTASADSTGRLIDDVSAAAVGTMSASGAWWLEVPIVGGSAVTVQCQPVVSVTETHAVTPDGDGSAVISLADAPAAGTLEARWTVGQTVRQPAGLKVEYEYEYHW
jgi:hypothetical protein